MLNKKTQHQLGIVKIWKWEIFKKISSNLAKSKRVEEMKVVSEISSITKILSENLSDIQKAYLVDLQIK